MIILHCSYQLFVSVNCLLVVVGTSNLFFFFFFFEIMSCLMFVVIQMQCFKRGHFSTNLCAYVEYMNFLVWFYPGRTK